MAQDLSTYLSDTGRQRNPDPFLLYVIRTLRLLLVKDRPRVTRDGPCGGSLCSQQAVVGPDRRVSRAATHRPPVPTADGQAALCCCCCRVLTGPHEGAVGKGQGAMEFREGGSTSGTSPP